MEYSEISLDIFGEAVNYRLYAGGEKKILILHGRGGRSDSWHEVAVLLQKSGYTVFVPDLPGFGKTSIRKTYDTKKYALFVASLVDKLNLSGCYLLGHSNGGRIATELVSSGLISIKKLILNNSAGIVHPLGLKQIILSWIGSFLKLFSFLPGYEKIRKILYRMVGGHDYISAQNQFLKKSFISVVHKDMRSKFNDINIPTQLIWGEHDSYTPLRDGKLMHSMISGSSFVLCSGEKHGIHLHNPKLLVSHIVGFFDG